MSAPVSLAASKLFYPETEKSNVENVADLDLPERYLINFFQFSDKNSPNLNFSEERNALEAISNGAVNTVFIVAAIIANLIVFLALLALIDNCTEWFVARFVH